MLTIKYQNTFKKEYRKIIKRGYDSSLFEEVVRMLVNEIQLPQKYRDHELKGEFKGYRECHIQPDWLLIYKIEDNKLILTLARTGTHSDLFNK